MREPPAPRASEPLPSPGEVVALALAVLEEETRAWTEARRVGAGTGSVPAPPPERPT